jgi:hypothetical protein
VASSPVAAVFPLNAKPAECCGPSTSPVCGAGWKERREARVWKAATSKAEPRQKQDWILKCLQGG